MIYAFLILCVCFWVAIGFAALMYMDKGGKFIKWVESEPTGVLGFFVMIAWPFILYRAIAYNKLTEKHKET